ncbi:MAG: hypothetical protein AAF682_30600 [Planctomycetota bacterium]
MPIPTSAATALAGAFAAFPATAQLGLNDASFNNGSDTANLYSSPSIGAAPTDNPPDLDGDLFWRVHSGADFMAYVDPAGSAVMEVDSYFESLFDTDWSTTPSFYTRVHGPALPNAAGTGLEPAFLQQGLTTEVVVVVGPSGFPCPGYFSYYSCLCPPPGFVDGYLVDLTFGSTVGSGVVLPADGTAASDMATTWFVPGGMLSSGGSCGLGDYDIQDLHSIDETQADPLGLGLNPSGGFQFGGQGPVQELITSMAEPHTGWRSPILNPVADSGGALGVEVGDNGGGAMNGRALAVSGGGASLGVEIRDYVGAQLPNNVAVAGASTAPLPLPGVSALGAVLLVVPGGLFGATASVWQGTASTTTFAFTAEGAFVGAQLPVPPALGGSDLYLQGLVLDVASFVGRATNRVRVQLL